MFIDVVTVAAFAVICLLVFLAGEVITGGRRTANRALRARARNSGPGDEPRRRSVNPLIQALATVVPQFKSEVSSIERDLRRAGYYKSTALVEYMATRNSLIVCILIVTGILAVSADPGSSIPTAIMGIGLITAGLGYGLPRMVLNRQANRRVYRIQRGLPDALDLVTMCVTGGLPLHDALHRVSSELQFSNEDIATEFEIIRRHADADKMASALRQFAQRIDVPDVSALAALVTQTERLGTHVATAICDYADSVRKAHRHLAEERANKTSIKMLFPVVLCLAPPIYILLCGPPILKLRNFLIEERRPGGILAQEVPGVSPADLERSRQRVARQLEQGIP